MRRITINTTCGPAKADAYVYGCWAAHRAYNAFGWTVTHAPSGHGTWSLSSDLSEDDARRIARLLSKRVPDPKMVKCKPTSPMIAPIVPTEEDRRIIEATFAEELAA